MGLNRNKFYFLLLSACILGYIWIYFCSTKNVINDKSVVLCLLKQSTTIPCPSCGTTRAVMLFTKGDFIEALNLNPIGFFVAIIMLISPMWIAVDLIFRINSLFFLYQKIEDNLRKPMFAIPLMFLVIINWIWNITKGL